MAFGIQTKFDGMDVAIQTVENLEHLNKAELLAIIGGVIKAKDAPKLVFYIGNRKIAVDQVEQPAREFAGLSDENGVEVEQVAADFFEAMLQ